MATKSAELALECKRQSESCLYTSTTLFIWLKFLKAVRLFFIVIPLVAGALAGWNVLTRIDHEEIKLFTALCAFVAGLMPTVYSALKFDENLEKCARLAGEFKNLQDRFRQAAVVSSKKPFVEFEGDVKPLMDRLEQARSVSITPPEWIFKRAQKKVKSRDYDFDVDIELEEMGSGSLPSAQEGRTLKP